MSAQSTRSPIPTIAVVGAGGIGHPAVAALARAEVRLRIIDDDRVEESNLHRLPFASERDVGAWKGEVLLRVRRDAGGGASDDFVAERFVPESAQRMLNGVDLVIEGSDNYATKFLVADACNLQGIASVHGAAVGWLGTVLPVVPSRSACYRCIFEDLPDGEALDCASAGVFGPVTAMVGALMAHHALQLLANDTSHAGSVGSYDGFRNTFRSARFPARRDCPLCGRRTIRTLDPQRYVPTGCTTLA